MSVFLTIIAVIAVFVIFNKINRNIDKEEEKARTTPGVAQYIRTHFSKIVDCIDSSQCYKKEFEGSDHIRYKNECSDMTIHLHQWSGHLKITVTRNKTLIKEWDLSPKDMSILLLSEIKNTTGIYTYWESYKDRNPRKADAIKKLTKINLAKESDKSAREIVESIERWSINTGWKISELKSNFIESLIETFGDDNLEIIRERTVIEMIKEATTFKIDKEHTIARFMIEAIDEYLQDIRT